MITQAWIMKGLPALLRHSDVVQGPLGTVRDFNERSDMKCVQGVTICCDCDLDIILEGRTKLEEG